MSDFARSEQGPVSAGAAAVVREKFDLLRALLRRMFQLDRGDLDFGLYRIMKLKSEEVEAFLAEDLLPQVKEALRLAGHRELVSLEQKIEEDAEAQLKRGMDPDRRPAPALADKREQIGDIKEDVLAEADVFHHLAAFFDRYYSEGDFVSKRRYSSAGDTAYLIPYDGEEVKLYWANSDQYYIKTTENYATYEFRLGSGETARPVRFEIAAADNEKDAIQPSKPKQRRFVLRDGANAVEAGEAGLTARFEHRPLTAAESRRWPGNGNHQQSRINEASAKRILKAAPEEWSVLLAAPAPTEANGDRTALDRHLERYTAKNTFDYFIHKDLGGFLRRELDLYLNTEVLNLADLARGDARRLQRSLARVRAARLVGGKIIDFLAQLEDFQKRLWLKKKFVLESHWCVTLDRVPESFYPEIAANEAQREEWVRLFAIDQIHANLGNGATGYAAPLSVDFLRHNPFLVLDTRHFDRDFTDRLLAALSDAGPLFDRQDGLLVHGENFQALNLLQARYGGQVDCVYIDPPYNTNSSPILYKNDYKDSSWLSLMENRVRLAKPLLSKRGILCCAIDDEEAWRLRALLQDLFAKEIGVAPVRSTPIGRTSDGKMSPTHEYALFYGREGSEPGPLVKTDKEKKRYPLEDAQGRYAWRNLLRTGTNDRRVDRPKLHYPIFVGEDDRLRVPRMEWDDEATAYRVLDEVREGEVAVWPNKMQGGEIIEKNWERGWERVSREIGEYRVQRDNGASGGEKISLHFKQRMDESSVPKTWWGDSKYASSNHGAKVLKGLFGDAPFDFAKSVPLVEDSIRASGGGRDGALVLDFFAGSGTTGHAVVDLNRSDGGARRYLLVDIGEHFDDVVLARMKKVVYSADWQAGEPVSRQGVSQFFRYLRIESYEDTMEGLERTEPSSEQAKMLRREADLREDYRLRYALGRETAGSACLLGKEFRDPFGYTLSVVRDGARCRVPVDLPTTFEFLLGLRLASRRRIEGVLTQSGVTADGRRALILWRDLGEMDQAGLDAWFERNRDAVLGEAEVIYTNGDQTLNALRRKGDSWVAETLDAEFRDSMFAEEP